MKLKELRKIKKVTQTDVASFLNMPYTTYQAYEQNRCSPNIPNLIKLADYFNVSLDYLCDRKFSNGIGFLNEEQKILISKIEKLSEKEIARVNGYIDLIIEENKKTLYKNTKA